jgi:hypothetical protein
MGMSLLHKNQKGLTMIELLIGFALTALVTTGVTMAIFQTFTGSSRSANHMVAVRQVQETGYWMSFYAYAAQNATITGDSGFPVILRWIDFEANEKLKLVFTLDDSGLKGSCYVGDAEDLDPVRTSKIPAFEFIDPDETSCRVSGGSSFRLPVAGDAFVITGGATPDNGIITPATGLSVTKTGSGATVTYVVPAEGSPYWEWTTTTAEDTITVTATSSNRIGSWTSEIKAATAAITAGSTQATLSSARGLVFTITATVGTGRQEGKETRTYIAVPKPAT